MMPRVRSSGEGTIRQRKDGRHEGRYVDVGGNVRVVYGKTKGAVATELAKRIGNAAHGVSAPPANLTVADHLTHWLENRLSGQHIRISTYSSYEWIIRCHIIPSIGGVRVKSLSPKLVQDMLDQKAREGLSRRSIEYMRSILRASFGKRERARLMVSDTDVPKNARRRPPQAQLGSAELEAILRAVKGTRLYPLVLTAAYTGLRQGEMLGLQWQDVELELNRLTVRHQLQRGRLVDPKTERSLRRLPLLPVVRETLEQVRLEQIAERRITPWVFASLTGGPLDGVNVTHRFQAALRRSGLPVYRWHDLRLACGTLLLERGVDIKIVSSILGHSQITLTQNTYQVVTEQLALQAFARLGAV
jgi:integrase